MFDWRNVFRGMAMGISDLIPGVSGGTIAVLLGIYDQFINAISGITTREWKKHIPFLFTLGVGMISAILILSHAVEWLLEEYPEPTNFFFLGLIAGILPFLLKEASSHGMFKTKHIVVFLIGAVLIASMAFFKPIETGNSIETLTPLSIIGLFLAGACASMAMLLPGISGSFILLIIGVYHTAINAITTLNLPIIFIIGSGIAFGFIFSSKGIRFLLSRFPLLMYALILGLVFGSLFVVFPGLTLILSNILLSLGAFFIGLVIAILLGNKE
ncbi:DUF368 domain-containing protein [Psychrobacillus psychrodurans]|uniref:DUF368 domain-containing protein n=1 Tax=Psychrobacillus psychrodurans TaxID=126157 RepID=UPI0008F38BEE|nr:DUF368 domain-containing protein [Psychrobacillus psychrodurans]MCZ8542447.1 DUF368 domain-containing protein [Psychrobacillus psychrodurans]SFN23014.1 putative membrane protein [Psychrobacillus psychrodurans]